MTLPTATTENCVEPHATPAVRFVGVSKSYRLYDQPHERLMDQIGLTRLLFWKTREKMSQHLFHALRHVNLTIQKGERVGIVGRNGAGKTTLLKLITQNFAPTGGFVEVHGAVQALMQLGIGFHPEFSGYENIKAALHYNGLAGTSFKEALEDVIEFVELEEFLHQPLKTYSLGMNARLQFAAATAIRPDILIIDEVLGAGDAYFSAKSSQRVRKLTERECTLLLVSHSTPQVLQFCSRAIWLERGDVVMDGPAQDVVGAYEVFSEQRVRAAQQASVARQSSLADASAELPRLSTKDWISASIAAKERIAFGGAVESAPPAGDKESVSGGPACASRDSDCHLVSMLTGESATSNALDTCGREIYEFKATLENGLEVFRWPGKPGLKYLAIGLLDDNDNETNVLVTHRKCTIRCRVLKEVDKSIRSRIFITAFNLEALRLMWITSPVTEFDGGAGDRYVIDVLLNPLLLGGGTYILSVSLFDTEDLTKLSAEQRYDLLARCLEFKVVEFDARESPVFHHPASWSIRTNVTEKMSALSGALSAE
jgi:lipopolysaccharide transport system ATP-binding protein